MITETEAQARAEYMGLVHHQLKILRNRRDLEPEDYLQLVERSSLKLGEIEWVRGMILEASAAGKVAQILDRLIMYYEGYFEALARILEVKPDVLFSTFDTEKVKRLEAEMYQVVTRQLKRPTT